MASGDQSVPIQYQPMTPEFSAKILDIALCTYISIVVSSWETSLMVRKPEIRVIIVVITSFVVIKSVGSYSLRVDVELFQAHATV